MANIALLRHEVAQHHFERSENIIAARGTNERGCDKSQMMLQQVANDVGYRPMMLRFAQTDTPSK